MPTKAELSEELAQARSDLTDAGATIASLQADVIKARSRATAAEAARDAAVTSRNEAVAKVASLQVQMATLTAEAPAAAAPAARTPGTAKLLGSMTLRTGLLVLTDPFCLDRSWKTKVNAMGSAFAIDIRGEHAERLALSERRYTSELLPDGTWRVVTPDQTTSAFLEAQLKRLITKNSWATAIEVHPVLATTEVLRDACRAEDIGFARAVDGTDMLAVSLDKNARVEVALTRDKDGNVRELRLVLPAPR